ncbi:hypothetical protein EUB48_03425 [Rhodoferax sediminis]|uniref:Fibronectin type-III domain-containing protein n=2 Tax=Rhodoferax sediminis TaxID=2509614 RepID=A0A515D7Q9_9BURK|nr:hypothetical protein EUB48_03425 [Rhodoferax sediminis]
MTAFTRSFLLRSVAALIISGSLAACGGGGDVTVVASPAVAPLTLALTRVGPEAVQVDWSDDSYVASFQVVRDGYPLATVTTTSLVDASVLVNETYCYQVQGYDAAGQLVAATSSGCITIIP